MNSGIIFGRWKQLTGQQWPVSAVFPSNDCSWLAGNTGCFSSVLQEDYGSEQEGVSSEKRLFC